jgi:hypothetical protein
MWVWGLTAPMYLVLESWAIIRLIIYMGAYKLSEYFAKPYFQKY